MLPLRIGLRTFGLVALERTEAFDATQASAAERVLEEQALRLETALLFSEVRSLATAEERRRLAREIHDGIAQELASSATWSTTWRRVPGTCPTWRPICGPSAAS